MKGFRRWPLVLAAIVTAAVALAVSCATTGAYKPLYGDENVFGPVQVTFEVRDSTLFAARLSKRGGREAVNTQAYIKLLEAAQRMYGSNIDVRDIIWVTGRTEKSYTEISATGKVIEAP